MNICPHQPDAMIDHSESHHGGECQTAKILWLYIKLIGKVS